MEIDNATDSMSEPSTDSKQGSAVETDMASTTSGVGLNNTRAEIKKLLTAELKGVDRGIFGTPVSPCQG